MMEDNIILMKEDVFLHVTPAQQDETIEKITIPASTIDHLHLPHETNGHMSVEEFGDSYGTPEEILNGKSMTNYVYQGKQHSIRLIYNETELWECTIYFNNLETNYE